MTSNPLSQRFNSPWAQALACAAVLLPLIYWQLRPQQSVTKIQPEPLKPATARLKLDQAKLPLSFEANQGQFAAPVKFAARAGAYQIALTPQETVFTLNGQPCPAVTDAQPKAAPCQPAPATEVRLRFAQANPNPQLRGETELPGKVNYFIGNDPRQWRAGLPTFEKIRARNVYPGVDAVFYSNQRQFEYDLIVAPNADPAQIKLAFAGAQSLRLDRRGDLLLETPSGEMRQRAPVIYQDVNGQRQIIAGHYVQTGVSEVGFTLGEYDRQLPLVIDPVLVYSTYLGGRFSEAPRGLSVDATGTYVFGETQTYDLPGAAPLAINRGIYKTTDSAANWNSSNTGLNTTSIASIAYAPSNPNVVYAGGSFKSTDGGNTWSTPANTGLPGSNYQALAVDPTSDATVYVGARFSSGSNSGIFKTTDGGANWSAASTGLPASPQIARLAIVTSSPATLYAALGSGGVYKSTNGGGSWSAANTGLPSASFDALVIDQTNPAILYAGGGNTSAIGVYKSINGGASWTAITTGMGAQFVFSLAIDPINSNTLYAGTFGGIFKTTDAGANWSAVNTGLTTAGRLFTSIVINPAAPAIVYASAATNTPTGTTASAGIYKTTNGGTNWSAANAGTINNEIATLAINPANPTTLLAGGFGRTVLFVSKLNPAGDALLYTSYIGGTDPNGSSAGGNFTTDASGNAYLTGQTFASNFPTTAGAFQTTKSGIGSNYVCKLNSAGGLVYSTYLDGNNSSGSLNGNGGIAVDGTGKIYVTGFTRSAVFPTTPGAFQTVKGDASTSSGDAFLAKLNPAGAGTADLMYSTYLGGNGNEAGLDVAVDASGIAYLTGFTASTTFPVTANAFQATHGGSNDVFVAKLNPGGNGTADLLYSTYLGSTGADAGSGTPTTAGTANFMLRATDANQCTGERAYTLTINAAGSGLQFFALPSPVRLLDTRPGASPNACSQPNAPINGGTSRLQAARNFCGIPATAQALTGNVTTVNSGGGYLTLFPSGTTQPTVASTNYGVNEIVNNVFTVGLGAGDGAFNLFALNTTDVVVDVTGYYAPPGTANPGGLYFHPLPSPVRLLETRAGQPVGCVKPGAPLVGGTDSLQTATTACTGIPAAARSVVGNATTVGPLGAGYLTLYPADVPNAPLVASSNYNTNQIVNGPFTAGLSAGGQFKIFTTQTTDLVVDVLGYYSTEAVDANGAGLLFTPLARPVRLLETRNNPAFPGCFKPNAPLNGQQVYTQTARGLCDGLTIPATALGVVGNATVVFPVGIGFLTLWPSSAAQPTVATSNYNTNEVINRHFIVGLGNADGAFKLFSAAATDLVIDLSGYFAP